MWSLGVQLAPMPSSSQESLRKQAAGAELVCSHHKDTASVAINCPPKCAFHVSSNFISSRRKNVKKKKCFQFIGKEMGYHNQIGF